MVAALLLLGCSKSGPDPAPTVEPVDEPATATAPAPASRPDARLPGWAERNPSPVEEVSGELPERRNALAVADDTTCAIRGEHVICWGTRDREHPENARPRREPGFDGARELAFMGPTLCARFANGRVRCGAAWVRDVGGAVQLAAGANHMCALRRDGRVFCWGSNYHGELDADGERGLSGPSEIGGLRAMSIAAGRHASCALDQEGALWCWGRNRYVHPDLAEPTAPRRIEHVTGAREVALRNHACVLVDDSIRCFGRGDETGMGGGTPRSFVRRTLSAPGARGLVIDGEATCWFVGEGTLRCYGATRLDGTLDADGALTVGDGFDDAALGALHACARRRDDSIVCWGDNFAGQVTGSPTAQLSFTRVPEIDDAIAVEGSSSASCALRRDGRVSCWGRFGDPAEALMSSLTPRDVEGVRGAESLSVTGDYGCVVARRRALCWGRGAPEAYTATPVPGLSDVRAVGVALNRACALTGDGRVACWQRPFGEPASAPEVVDGVSNAVEIGVELQITCARERDGAVRCWSEGEPEPRVVPSLDDARAITVGYNHACARRGDGRVVCWGQQPPGVGVERCTDYFEGCPVVREPLELPGVSLEGALIASAQTTCVLSDRVRCFGVLDDVFLPAGIHDPIPPEEGLMLPGLDGATDLFFGGTACAAHADGHVTCWGWNEAGQVGSGVGKYLRTPTVVDLGDVAG